MERGGWNRPTERGVLGAGRPNPSGDPRRARAGRRDGHGTQGSPPDVDAGRFAAPQGARTCCAHLANALGQVACQSPRDRSASRGSRLDRSLQALLGLVPRSARRPPRGGSGRRAHRREGAFMNTEAPQLAISRIFDAPRALVFRAFTDPDHLARPGGFQRWAEVAAAEPDLRINVYVDLTDVADGALLEGVMHVSGRLQEGLEPFEMRFRIEFYDEPGGRTRLEIRQWLPAHLAGPSDQGWVEAFEKLDAAL